MQGLIMHTHLGGLVLVLKLEHCQWVACLARDELGRRAAQHVQHRRLLCIHGKQRLPTTA